MKELPEQIAARLMAPASTSAVWTYDQVRTLVNLDPRICILTLKVGGEYQDFMIDPVQAAEIAELLRYSLEVPEDVAQANDESPGQH